LEILVFFTGTTKDEFYVMVVGDVMMGGNESNSNFEVSLSTNEPVVELDNLNDTFHSHDHLLKHDVNERNDYRARLETALKDLKFARGPIRAR